MCVCVCVCFYTLYMYVSKTLYSSLYLFLSSFVIFALKFQDSVVDMVGALKGILHLRSEPVLCLASTVAVKMVNALPSPVIQHHVIEIVHPLSSLLNCANVQVSLSCAIALSLIISNISMKKESEVWEILRETKTVTNTVCNIKEFSGRTKLVEYFQEMILLLSKILWRWSSSRFCIWNDVELLNALDLVSLEPSFSAKISVLQLYSSIGIALLPRQLLCQPLARVCIWTHNFFLILNASIVW